MNEQNIFHYLTKASLKVNARTKQPRNTPERVLLRILPGGVQPGSSNPDPNFRPKNVIFYTLFQTRPLKSIPTKTEDVSVRLRTSQKKIQGRTPQPFCTEQQNSSEVTPVERPVARQAGRAG